MLSALMLIGTVISLNQAESTSRRVVLARAEAGAAALEQTTLRLLQTAASLDDLAQSRLRLLREDRSPAAEFIEQRMQRSLAEGGLGLSDVAIISGDGSVLWSNSGDPAGHGIRPERLAGITEDTATGLAIVPPHGGGRQPSLLLVRSLPDSSGRRGAHVVVSVDALALSAAIAADNGGGSATIQSRADGSILARTDQPLLGFSLRFAASDPLLTAARSATGGQMRYEQGETDRLIGWRAPPRAPVIVTQAFDTDVALADFYKLRRIVLAVVAALTVGALIATRLFLANFLLRRDLAQQALRDPLTGLANRRYFAEVMALKVREAQAQGLNAAVLIVDLDGFKQVNDTRGHPVGDALLQEVAIRLERAVSEGDTVMRLGGDEFAIVRIGRTQRRDVTALGRFIVAEMDRPFEIDGFHLRIAGSVGCAMPPEGGDTLNDLLHAADIALYFVKSQGGGAYQLFDPAMEESVRTRRSLEIDLREALGRRELELYYQPLVQLDPRRVSGFEALLRWHHPVLGMVMPSRFITIAEETGLIADIGAWVIKRACEEAATWPAGTRVAVNLSPVQFERSDLVDIVSIALRETKLEPSRLELEITEGVVMSDMGDAVATMHKLKALGVRLALDDFGTGYASLSYLRSFPFDKVKIDGSFTSHLSGDSGTIVRAMLGLCAHLGLDTLVECVETADQLEWLRREGCTEVQGHYFSPPRPGAGVAEILALLGDRGGTRQSSFAATAYRA